MPAEVAIGAPLTGDDGQRWTVAQIVDGRVVIERPTSVPGAGRVFSHLTWTMAQRWADRAADAASTPGRRQADA